MDNEAALNAIEAQIDNLLEERTKLLQGLAELDASLLQAQSEHDRLSGRIASTILPVDSLAAIREEAQRPLPPDPPMEIIVAQVVRTWRSIYKYPPRLWNRIIEDVQSKAREEIQRRKWDTKSNSSSNHI